jgi:signal transduction histidine kinase/DNA-binding response OmpR family regulator/ligand-binding sensor domain-containing protein
MGKLKPILTFLILTCCTVASFAQSNIRISHYTKDYGLNFRWVYDITQDDQGFMWFATHTGLRRYDGVDFVTYQHSNSDPNSLSNNTVHRVTKDSEGNIWAYPNGKVFNKLELKSGEITRISSFIKGRAVQSRSKLDLKHFGSLSNGGFIVLLQEEEKGHSSLWKYIKEKEVFEHLIDVPTQGTDINYFTERSDGKLWLWGKGKGHYLVDLNSSKIEEFLFNSALQSELPIDQYRNFWYPSNSSEENGLKSFIIPDGLEISEIERVRLDNLGNIWFYADDNLYRFDREREILDQFVDPMFKKSNEVQIMFHMFEDNKGAYWNGHFLGAVQFTKRSILFDQYLTESEESMGAEQFSAREILEISDSKLLVKENEHELFIVDLVTKKAKKLDWNPNGTAGKKSGSAFYSMVLGKDGYLWINQSDKLIRLNIETGRKEAFDIPMSQLARDAIEDPFNRYWPRIFEDASGRLWWTDLEGINIFNKTTKELTPVQVEHAPLSVEADFKFGSYNPSEDVIYGSYEQGIYVIDCKAKTSSLIEVFSKQEIRDILITGVLKWRNEYWLSTNKGVIRYNPATKERRSYTRKEGLSSNIVATTIGSKEHLWVATLNGLSQLDPQNDQIVSYYKEDGIPSNNFNNSSYLQAKTGKLYLGGRNGIVGFYPDDFKTSNKKSPRLNLVNLVKYNQNRDYATPIKNSSYNKPDKIIIGANERTLSFKYMLDAYDDADKNQYAHYLDGLEKDWIADGNRNEVSYLQLPPGNYIFKVKAIGANKISASNEIAIPIVVRQYWYLRWWAIVIYVLLMASATYFLYKYLLEQKLGREEATRLKELDQVKTKMYTNITHEIRTPLTVMLGMNDAVKGYTEDGETEKVYHANEMIERNGKNLLNLVNQMLELSRLEAGLLKIHNQQGNIVDYLKYRLESFQSYAEEKDLQIHFQAEENEIIMDYDVDKISNVIGNLVSNAIKFTPEKGEIFVSASRVTNVNGEPFLELHVRDTGIGIDADKIDLVFDRFYQVDDSSIRTGEGTGIGLSLTKELVKLLKGTISLESEINEGTDFCVVLPITKNENQASQAPLHTSDEWSGSINTLSVGEESYLSEDQNLPLVLIVEDNSDVAHYVSVSIKEDYRTVRASNGHEGLEKAIELIPDVIISDVMMPLMDGFELCDLIKKDERTSHIPVILLTGKADIESKIEGLNQGADAYLAKPFNRRELLIRLKNLLSLRAEIQKRYSDSDFTNSIENLPAVENSFLLKIKAVVLEHIDNDEFDIVQLCKLMLLSRAQLHRKLTALTGESTSQLIRKIRLEKAKELLDLGELNVSEVAYMVGFKTQAHFSRVFSEAFGVPPSDYRNKELT